jgi:uncharacterized membrane protein
MSTPMTVSKNRISSIDLLRGIVMVIMAIDHVRDFFHITASTDSPTNLDTTTPQLFFTRWITHFCAPVFVLLAGSSAYLAGLKKTTSALGIFLIKRGSWLILIEIFIMSMAFTFDPLYHLVIFQVIWSIGISLVLLGLLIRLPYGVLLTIGLVIVFGHNLLDYPEAHADGKIGFLWDLLHHGFFKAYQVFPHHVLIILYPFLPWTGVMICGYCMGRLFQPGSDPVKRKKILTILGLSMTILFVVLRLTNRYGDPQPWTTEKNGLYTFLSFLNLTKYPPSLMYLGMTIGPALILLAWIENIKNRLADFFTVFGRVPFFYYIIHFYLIHILCVVFFFIEGYSTKDIIPKLTPFHFRPDNFGFSLWGVYAIWLFVLIVTYPLCKKYGEYKKTHHQWWLSYL